MTRAALASAVLCFALGAWLLTMALRRLGISRLALRARGVDLAANPRGWSKIVGRLQPVGATLSAPFTERGVVWVRCALRGVPPGGGVARDLWAKTLSSSVQLVVEGRALPIDLQTAHVVTPRLHRQGTLRALVLEVRIVPRVLARAGYASAPPATQWFQLVEEVLLPGERVAVFGDLDGAGRIRGTAAHPILVSSLRANRLLLRAAWGPVLAAMLAIIIAATGVVVMATWSWLR